MESGDGGMCQDNVIAVGQSAKGPVGFGFQFAECLDDLSIFKDFKGEFLIRFAGPGGFDVAGSGLG